MECIQTLSKKFDKSSEKPTSRNEREAHDHLALITVTIDILVFFYRDSCDSISVIICVLNILKSWFGVVFSDAKPAETDAFWQWRD